MKTANKLGALVWLLILSSCTHVTMERQTSNNVSEDIRVNQVGYLVNHTKKFSVANTQASYFQLLDANNNIVASGDLIDLGFWQPSGENLKVGNFSSVSTPANNYKVYIDDKGVSSDFDIDSNLYDQVVVDVAKSFYLQRASLEIEEKYAGRWSRELGHLDDRISYHPTTGLKGTTAAPKGWYDAGDFGKYVVNGAVSASQMLTLYELYPEQYQDDSLNIPESGNGENDLLDEVRHQLEWLLSMQDLDGGVFHKLTTKTFEGMVLASAANKPRFMMAKSTSASLDFAAVMAQAARVYSDVEFSARMLSAAELAWQWSLNNNDVIFSNAPDVITGQYPDDDFNDEFFWAAAELYTTTEKTDFLNFALDFMSPLTMVIGESWRTYLNNMGVYSLLHHSQELPNDLVESLSAQLVGLADKTIDRMNENAYSTAIDEFEWGSNSDVLNALTSVAHAYYLTGDKKYLDAVVQGIDYVFGRNATGYSFVTGYGDKQPMNIHHRQSSADGIVDPIPGFIVGGPNGHQQDVGDVRYLFAEPAKSYMDVEPSYASNEVAINWNAPLVFVLGFINANL